MILAPGTVQELLSGWRTVDFEEIANQSALVTNCTQEVISYYVEEFHKTLSNISGPNGIRSLKVITDFADNALAYGVSLLEGSSPPASPSDASTSNDKPNIPQQDSSRTFLLKWHYISSQIIRDLTIKSHPAFGPFQIMSLFIE